MVGDGDFLEIAPSLEVDEVVEGNPSPGRIMFFRGGNLVDVNDFSEAEAIYGSRAEYHSQLD